MAEDEHGALFLSSVAIGSQKAVEEGGIEAKVGQPQLRDGGSEIEETALGGAIEDAEGAGDGEAEAAGFLDAFPVIHEDEIGMEVEGEENGFLFAGIEVGKWRGGGLDGERDHLQPSGAVGEPQADGLGGGGMFQFGGDGLGDEDFGVAGGEEIGVADEDEVAEGGGVGDDEARHAGSEAEAVVGVAIELEVVPGVVEPDLVEFEEAIEVIAGGEAEEAAELGGGAGRWRFCGWRKAWRAMASRAARGRSEGEGERAEASSSGRLRERSMGIV